MPLSPRTLRPSSSFTPKSISGLVAWWDASASSSISLDGSNNVSSWADLSGNSRTLSQTTANNRPAYNTAVANGKPVVNFDGSNDAMLATFTLAQPCHYFMVWRYDSAYVSGNPRVFDGATGGSMSFFRSTSAQMALNAGGSNLSVNISDADGQAFSVTEIRVNGASSSVLRNGVDRTANPGTNIGSGSAGGIYLGVYGNGFSAPGDVSFAEILIYSSVLSGTNASKVRSYLGKKYGISVT
jgi:hypothetical protein